MAGVARWRVVRFASACFDTLWFGKLWFGKLWFGKLTNQTNQPHECGSVVQPIKAVLPPHNTAKEDDSALPKVLLSEAKDLP